MFFEILMVENQNILEQISLLYEISLLSKFLEKVTALLCISAQECQFPLWRSFFFHCSVRLQKLAVRRPQSVRLLK